MWERDLIAMKYHNLFGTAGDSQKSKDKALNPPGTELQRKMIVKFQPASSDEVDVF